MSITPTTDFYCPGSVLRLSIDSSHPVGYGMPKWYSGYSFLAMAIVAGVTGFGLYTAVSGKSRSGELGRK